MPEFVPCDPITPDVVQFSEEPTAQFVLFTNARIFDGKSERLTEPQEVLVHKHLIRKVGPLVPVPQDVKLVKIDCGGRTLLPGLIDMHSQVCLQEGFFEVKKYDTMTMGALAAHDLQDYLQQGFTSCRDAGGNTLGLAKAIQERRLAGPRLFSSGAYLTQTAGHGDPAPPFSYGKQEERLHGDGFVSVCDGIHEVLKAARRNLRSKATQLTLITGGSTNDALHGTQFTLEEMKAAVSVASDFGTYAMAHAYHDRSINRALDAGVKCIEHGYLMSEATMRRLVDERAALSIQATIPLEGLADPDSLVKLDDAQRVKAAMVNTGAKKLMGLIRKHKPLVVSGGDLFGNAYQRRQADNIIHLVTLGGMSHVEALKSATSNAATVLSWSGPMSPYPEGSLGVIEEGAYADIIVVNGNPLEDIYALKRDNVELVLKNGVCYKYKMAEGRLQVVTFRLGNNTNENK